MTEIEPVAALLGGPRILGRTLETQLDFVPLLRDGLPYGALEALATKLGLSVDVTTTSLRVGRMNLGRENERDRLDAQASERIFRLADIAARANAVLGSFDNARVWLTKENHALGGVKPITMLDTDVGTRAVEHVLTRVDHGVYG